MKELFLIVDYEKHFFLIKAQKENFYKKYKFLKTEISYSVSKNEMENSNYIGEEIYNKKDEPKLGIAHIPNLKISHYCANNITNPFTKVNCVYNHDFDKWIPINILTN